MAKYTFEHLVSTMNNQVVKLVEKLNIQTDAVVINQQDKNYHKNYDIDNQLIREYSFDEIGVGLSRNAALNRSHADICIITDDDMVYVDNYLDIIEKSYEKYPDADMILFNVRIYDDNGLSEKSQYSGRVHFLNSLKYGTVSFTFKRSEVLKNRISFSLLFGGGSKYGSGEDNLFLWDCLKAGLKVYAVGEVIADVYNEDSSWFEGYTEQFFRDKGALFEALSSNFSTLLIFQYALRKRELYKENYTVREVISLMKKGRHRYRTT